MLLPCHGEFMLWVLMPRAVPMAEGVCSFRGQMGVLREDWEWYGLGC
jgi:hypothetical protein